MAVIAQLSDIHITTEPDGTVADASGPVRGLRAAVSSLLALPARPDYVVLTGDLTEHGLPEEYTQLRTILTPLPMPVHPVPGNHDDRDGFRKAFADHPGVADTTDHLSYTVEAGPGPRLVCCDSTIPGEPGGTLSEDRLAWLDATLAAQPAVPTIVALHHPPFRIGVRFIDELGYSDPEAFVAVISRHRQVVRVICGHVHRPAVVALAGTVAVTCPSTYRQLYLDLSHPGGGAMTGEPAGYALHLIDDDGTNVTHFAPIGGYRPLLHVG